jgi:hypothetical protein
MVVTCSSHKTFQYYKKVRWQQVLLEGCMYAADRGMRTSALEVPKQRNIAACTIKNGRLPARSETEYLRRQ